jgi:tetratricopeptide (TPR) repeat protein
MTNAMTLHHSDPEMLAAFVEGHLDGEQLQQLTAHLAECEECRSVIGEAMAFEREETRVAAPRRRAWWGVAAAAVIVAAASPLAWGYWRQHEIRGREQAVFEALRATGRPIEARFSEQNTYAAPRPTLRGVEDGSRRTTEEELNELRLQIATNSLIEYTRNDRSAAARRGAALALAMDGHPTAAQATILHIPMSARNAAAWNDIAAAHYAAAKRQMKPDAEYQQALAAAQEAVRLDPEMPEALFNLALIQQEIGPPAAAVEAWRRYLKIDSDSAWAEEAKQHIEKLTRPTDLQ